MKLGKARKRRKQRFSKGGLWCETKETQETLPSGKLRKQRNEEDAEENLKCGSLNSPRQLSMRKIRSREKSMEKIIPLIIDERKF